MPFVCVCMCVHARVCLTAMKCIHFLGTYNVWVKENGLKTKNHKLVSCEFNEKMKSCFLWSKKQGREI